MTQALYRKWRPARFDEVIGQEHVTRTLRNAIASGRSGHAYLFCGPRGTGKTTTARLLAKAVNCLYEEEAERPCNECSNCLAIGQGRFLDLIEIDAASNTGVDDIRDLRDKINFAPSEGRFKVYIIDEVHMLSTAAFNALLKTLEEPPPHAKFVLATTEEHKVPATIKSRCQQFNFRLLTLQEILERLRWIAAQEQLEVEPPALELIARQGAGSIRDAESLLDQLVAAPGDAITLERAQAVLGTASNQAVANLAGAWLDGDGPGGLRIIHDALASGADVRQFARQMVDYLRQVLLLQAAGDELPLNLPAEEKRQMLAQAQRAERTELIAAVKAFNEAAVSSSSSWQPQLPLELAFISLLPQDAQAVANRESIPATAQQEKMAPAAQKATASPEPVSVEEAVQEPVAETGTAELQASQKPAQQPQPAPEAGGAITLKAVQSRWDDMVSQMRRQDKNLPALLNMARPLATEGNTIILGFDFPILKGKFEDKVEAREAVAETMSNLLGTKILVRCVVTDQYTPPPQAEATVATDAAESPDAAAAADGAQGPAVDRDEFYALADELGGQVRES